MTRTTVEINLDQIHDDEANDETANFLPPASAPTSVSVTLPKAMASEDKKHKHKPHTVSPLFQNLTTAAHACILLYVTLIIYFCFSGDFQFFTWHPLLLSIGWVFLMSEGILSLAKDNILTGTLPKLIRLRLHWIFQTIGLVLILIGFTVVFLNKNYLNKTHFKSWHGLFGFIGVVCSVPTCLDGILALYHGALRHYIRPRINKFLHIASGVATFVFGGLALILSVYTNWFARHSDNNILTFVVGLALVSVAVVWTLVPPAIACCRHIKGLLEVKTQ